MKSLLSLTAATIVATGLASEASAGTRSFILSGRDLGANSGGSIESIAGAGLPDSSDENIVLNLTLPKDYKKNSKVTLRLRLTISDSACGITMLAAGAIRFRQGKVPGVVTDPTSGFAISGTETFGVPSVATQTFGKEFTLKPATTGTIQSQLAGDNILLVIGREGTAGGDTCSGGLAITSVKVTYTTK